MSTENTEPTPSTSESTETETPAASDKPAVDPPAARILSGGCMCKSIRYKIARDDCQEHMSMSMYYPY